MAANEFAPVTPGEMSRNFWLNTAFRKISSPRRLGFRQTESPTSLLIIDALPRTPRFA